MVLLIKSDSNCSIIELSIFSLIISELIFKDSKKCSIVDLSGDDEADYSPLFDKIDRAIKVL